ncbi:CoA transferase [Gordonia sp. HY002]|uniref:CoA transferase n=1 Tax=Gordonia zhenghanii TaxID=2911516 RepID=UPI001EF01364|nr:CoA transferase [Gordonia zhenghanii]MCF8571927.1 CoA transferase [Gordonia zhenghanii]MCF8606995.1 CoA transferase [Gordonia zhenghanii]
MPTDETTTMRERWAAGGMARLTCTAGGTPDFSRAAVLTEADRLARPLGQDANTLLTGRSGMTGRRGHGRVSVGGSTRLLQASDGWIGVTLSRSTDLDSLPALLETSESITEPWRTLADAVRLRTASEIVERAQLLGIPAAELGAVAAAPPRSARRWPRRQQPIDSNLLVVDLSSMWAGPLCGQILAGLGATVVKVESPLRPDGTRAGDPDFFRWMNGLKLPYSADLYADGARLGRLLDVADVVIEASRPRALVQAGLDAHSRTDRPGRVWVRITGYGPSHPMRVAFGDDAAVAGALVGQSPDGPIFCGDAIADPLTGITAAHQVVESLNRGGGETIDVAMADVAATFAALPAVTAPPRPVELGEPCPPDLDAPQPLRDAEWVDRLVAARSEPTC